MKFIAPMIQQTLHIYVYCTFKIQLRPYICSNDDERVPIVLSNANVARIIYMLLAIRYIFGTMRMDLHLT